MIQIELSNPSFESCIKCIHSDDSEETCILRRCIHAVAQLKECYVPKKPTIEPQQKWIPCSERLPEPRMDVWTCSDIGQIQGYYEEHVGIWYASFGQGRDYLELYVTAWMPLPEPYQAERREK